LLCFRVTEDPTDYSGRRDIIAQDRRTLLRTVSFSRQSSCTVLPPPLFFLRISHRERVCFLYPTSEQLDEPARNAEKLSLDCFLKTVCCDPGPVYNAATFPLCFEL